MGLSAHFHVLRLVVLIQTETANDFTLNQGTALNQATFYGFLIPAGAPLAASRR